MITGSKLSLLHRLELFRGQIVNFTIRLGIGLVQLTFLYVDIEWVLKNMQLKECNLF